MGRQRGDTVSSYANRKDERLLCKIEDSKDKAHARWTCSCGSVGRWVVKGYHYRARLALRWQRHVEDYHEDFEL